MSGLTEYELKILREIAGKQPASKWGAAVGAALGFLRGRGLVDHRWRITDEGRRALAAAPSETP